MKTHTYTFTAGGTATFGPGQFFIVMAATNDDLKIEFLSNNSPLPNGIANNVGVGYFAKFRDGFQAVKVTSASAQNVQVGISDYEGGYANLANVAGTVQVTGGTANTATPPYVQFPSAQLVKDYWEGRNPLGLDYGYYAVAAPHNNVSRWSYTVPALRNAVIFGINMALQPNGTATAAAWARIYAQITRNGGAAQMMGGAVSLTGTNRIGAIVTCQNTVLLPGDKIEVFSDDGSTGGNSVYSMGMTGVEFDV